MIRPPRSKSLLLGLAAVVVVVLSACQPAPTAEQESVRSAMNRDRTANSRKVLGMHEEARVKAQKWAEHLAAIGKLEHSKLADGITGRWCALGENVGYGPSVSSIETAYMNSEGHRRNILDTRWNGVGTGYAKRGNTIYTVQVFIQTC